MCQTRTAKLTDLLSVFFTTFSFCVVFIVEVYTVLINCILRGKVGGSEKSWLLGGSEKNRLLNGVENGPADNVTCAVGNDRCLPEHKFESCSPLVNDPPRSARTHAMSQSAAVANRLFCISLGSAETF